MNAKRQTGLQSEIFNSRVANVVEPIPQQHIKFPRLKNQKLHFGAFRVGFSLGTVIEKSEENDFIH